MSVGVAVKAISSYFLLGTKSVGVYGAPISSLACNVTIVLLNFALILRYAQNADSALSVSKCFIKPFAASILSGGGAYAFYVWLSARLFANSGAFVMAAVIAILIYFILVFLLGVIDRDDIKMIPFLKNII